MPTPRPPDRNGDPEQPGQYPDPPPQRPMPARPTSPDPPLRNPPPTD